MIHPSHVPASVWPSRRHLGIAATACLVGTTLCGCPSPDVEGRYDDFVEQTADEREEAQNVKMDMGSQLADVTGTFLFALDTVAGPGTPLQFIATVTFTPEGEGGTLQMDLQPLALESMSLTEPRTPVGEVIPVPATMVDAGGAFAIDSLGVLDVTGEANPITGGDIKAEVSLAGGIISEDVFCGTVDGEVFEPLTLPLAGSTFAAMRIEATDPASLPTDVLLRCPEGGAMDDDGGGGSGGGEGSGSGG